MPPRQSIVILRSRMRFLPILCLVAIVLASVIGLPANISHVPKSVSWGEIPATANFVTDRHRVNIDLVSENVVPTPEFRTSIDPADKNCHGHVDITYQTVESCPSAIEGWLTSRIVMHGGDVMVLNNASQGTGLKIKKDSEYEVSIAGSQIYVFEDGNVVLASNDLCEPISDKFEVNRKGLICQPTQSPITAFRRFETIMALYTCFFFFLLGVSMTIFCLPLISKCTSPSNQNPPKPPQPSVQRDTSYGYVPLQRDESQISSARHFFVAPEDMCSMEAVFYDEYNPQMAPSTEREIAAAKSISGVVRATMAKHDPIKAFNSSLNLGPHISDITDDDDFPLKNPIYHLVDVDLNKNQKASNSRSDSGIAYDIINEEKEEDDISIQTCIENES